MFYQNDAYIMTEYGTRDCQEHREPCGAFYGMPFSGEIHGQFLPEQEQIQAQVSSRYFSKRDELILAHLRGERLDEQLEEPKGLFCSDDTTRIRDMVTEFRNDTQAPRDVVSRYRDICREYFSGKRYLLNELHDMYRTWIERRY